MQLGPLHFTGEISLGSVLTLLGLAWASFKYFRHFISDIQKTNERMDILWTKFYGKHEDDPDGWFNRMKKTEEQVTEMWKRLKFNRIHFDGTKSRLGDNHGG